MELGQRRGNRVKERVWRRDEASNAMRRLKQGVRRAGAEARVEMKEKKLE